MEPSARHRVPRPTRLIAVLVALLVAGGVAMATGSAAAHNSRSDSVKSASADRDSRAERRGERAESDGDRRAGRDSDDAADDRDGRDGDGQDRDGENGRGNDKGDEDKGNRDGDKDDKGKKKDEEAKDEEDEEFPGRDKAGPPEDDDFVDIQQVDAGEDLTKERRDGSSGSFIARCGTNANRHLNSDNFMVAPGKRNGAQHVHDYVGNLDSDAFSDEESLHAAGTTCDRNNQSTFFWPVLRDTRGSDVDADRDGGGKDGNVGRILRPRSAELRFLGSKAGKVEALPDDLTIITGDAKIKSNGEANKMAQWTCTGFTNRITDKYPLCPAGSKLMRIIDFPNCWDGENLDSANHRTHTAFADDDGGCEDGFTSIPQLRITLSYDRPDGRNFALDSFPDQRHDPRTEHADFMAIAPQGVLNLMANCINSGRNC